MEVIALAYKFAVLEQVGFFMDVRPVEKSPANSAAERLSYDDFEASIALDSVGASRQARRRTS